MPVLTEIPPDVVKSSGPLLIGYLLTWGLFGVLSVQTYIYYLAFPKDRAYTASLVYGIYLIELVQTILVTRDALKALALGFGDLEALEGVHLAWLTMPVMSGIVACIVQLFYAYRIHILSGSRVSASVIIVLALTQCAGAIVAGVAAAGLKSFHQLLMSKAEVIGLGIWSAAGSACDLIIAMFMLYYLPRSRTEIESTQALITRILLLTTGSGVITATVSVINVALFFAIPHASYFLVPGVLLGKLYSNSMMVVLNNRMQIVGGRHSRGSNELSVLSTLHTGTHAGSECAFQRPTSKVPMSIELRNESRRSERSEGSE